MKAIRYRIEHETRYAYDAPVSQSWQRAHLTPRSLPWQRLLAHAVEIDPRPDERHDGPDAWGNTVTHFGLHGAHRRQERPHVVGLLVGGDDDHGSHRSSVGDPLRALRGGRRGPL